MNELWLPRLHAAGWYGREFVYANTIHRIDVWNSPCRPAATLILEGEYPKPEAWGAIKNMLYFMGTPIQIVGCFNSTNENPPSPALSIRINANGGNTARMRNIAALFADAPVLVFLHSSFMPQPMLINNYLDCLRNKSVARGRLLEQPVSEEIFFNPDLGEDTFPWAFDLEENCAARKDIFLKMGGFDETMPNGAACLDFSCRLLRYRYAMDQQSYCASASGVMANGYDKGEFKSIIDALNINYAGKINECGIFWQKNLLRYNKESAF